MSYSFKLKNKNLNIIKILLILSFICNSLSWGNRGGQREKGPEKDLYKILEITKQANKDDIKKAYKKLSRKFHPDKDQNNKEKFVEISEAYEILSNVNKRRVYDTRGYQEAKNAGNEGEGGDGDMDIFSSFFGEGRVKKENKNEDQRIKLKVSLNDLYNGKELNYKYTRNVICPHCRGTGADSEDDIKVCTKCGGQGMVIERQQIAPGYIQQFQRQCPKCAGQGKMINKSCNVCSSSKIVPSIDDMSVYVEKGMTEGQEIVRIILFKI